MLFSLSALGVLTSTLLLPTACTSIRPCKNGTALVTVMLDASAAMADTIKVDVSIAGAAAATTRLDHTPGQTTGTIEVDFPSGYPQGQTVRISLVALRGTTSVGSGSTDKSFAAACESITVMVTGAGTDGGNGSGGGGTGGTSGAGGKGGVDAGGTGSGGSGAGGSDAGSGAGGSGAGGADAGTTGGTDAHDAGSDGNICPAGQTTSCGGVCQSTATDRTHCGATCAVCATTEVCNNGCVVAVAPAFTKLPLDPAGWQDPTGAALAITVNSTGYANAIYECRTGPDVSFTTTVPAWGPCDGATGVGRIHTPTPNSLTPEGNYRTEHRYRADSYISPVIATRYYVHHSLDKVATCPRAGMPATDGGPHHADAEYFAAAQAYSTANPTIFATSTVFPSPAAIPTRTDAIYLRNPFIKIPFTAVTQSPGMASSQGVGLPASWPSTGANYLFNERSLRHSWVINAAHTMILMKRNYIHPANHCREEIWVGHAPGATLYANHKVACEALVVNTHGNGLCFITGGAAPIMVTTEGPPTGAGSVTATLNSTTVNGIGTSFLGTANQFIQIPSLTGHWYKIAATPLPTATAITLTTVFLGASAPGQLYRVSPSTTYILQTGFAKMHPDAHNYATGVTAPKTPSPKTKCETLGCNTGLPWMTYLPP